MSKESPESPDIYLKRTAKKANVTREMKLWAKYLSFNEDKFVDLEITASYNYYMDDGGNTSWEAVPLKAKGEVINSTPEYVIVKLSGYVLSPPKGYRCPPIGKEIKCYFYPTDAHNKSAKYWCDVTKTKLVTPYDNE